LVNTSKCSHLITVCNTRSCNTV